MIQTPAQLFKLAVDEGFPKEVAVTVGAIALRESAGDPNAFNGNSLTGDRSYGLLQINMLDKNVNKFLNDNLLKGGKEELLFDPTTNMKAAFLLWGKNNHNLLVAWYIDKPVYKERYEAHLAVMQNVALGFL